MKSFVLIGLGRFGRSVACESLAHSVGGPRDRQPNGENVQHIADSVRRPSAAMRRTRRCSVARRWQRFGCCVVIPSARTSKANILITVMLKGWARSRSSARRFPRSTRPCSSGWAQTRHSAEKEMGQRLAQLSAARTWSISSACRTSSPSSKSKKREKLGRKVNSARLGDAYESTTANVLGIRPARAAIWTSRRADDCIAENDLLLILGANNKMNKVGGTEVMRFKAVRTLRSSTWRGSDAEIHRRSWRGITCEAEMLEEALRSGAVRLNRARAARLEVKCCAGRKQEARRSDCAEDALFRSASEVESPQNVGFSAIQPQWIGTRRRFQWKGAVLPARRVTGPGNLSTILPDHAEAFS